MVSLKKSPAGRKLWPVPEILESEAPFVIKETTQRQGMVCTDLVGKTMFVPTGDDAYGRMGRLHEMAHVAITPKDGMQRAMDQGIGSDYMNVAEDMRVNIFLQRKFTMEASIPEELFLHTLKGYVLNNDIKGATLMAAACKGMPEYETLIRFMDNEKNEWYYRIGDVVNQCLYMLDVTSFEQAMEVAKYLQGQFDPETMAAMAGDDIPEDAKRSMMANGDNPDLEWGEMTIITPPLTERLPARRLNRRVKPMESGTSMMFPSRMDVDDKIFGQIKRVPKGTVLIDVSTSMSLSSEQVKEMLKAVPGVTVACYSGYGDGTGHLTIIANKGSMMKLDPDYNWPGNNEVDGPALQWLAKQAEPRVWVCDGFVTGKGDDTSKKLTIEAFKIMKDNNIRRTGEIEETVALLKK